jgi:hypothetical protein
MRASRVLICIGRIILWLSLVGLVVVGTASYWHPFQTILAPSSDVRVHFAASNGNARAVWMRAAFIASYTGKTPLDGYAEFWNRVPTDWLDAGWKHISFSDGASGRECFVSCNVWIVLAAILAVRSLLMRHGFLRRMVTGLLFPQVRPRSFCRNWVKRAAIGLWLVIVLCLILIWTAGNGWVLNPPVRYSFGQFAFFTWGDGLRAGVIYPFNWWGEPNDFPWRGFALESQGPRFLLRAVSMGPQTVHQRFVRFGGIELKCSTDIGGGCGNETPAERARAINSRRSTWELYVPASYIFSIISLPLVLAAYRSIWRRMRRRNDGHCARCGYNLTGLPEPRCPECGTPFERVTSVLDASSVGFCEVDSNKLREF